MNDIIKKLVFTKVRATAYNTATDELNNDTLITISGDKVNSPYLEKLVVREGKKSGFIVLKVDANSAVRIEQSYKISYDDFVKYATPIR